MEVLISAVVIGIFQGAIYDVMALGLVASYRISRVINLGQAGIAAVGATIYWWMTSVWGGPTVLAVCAGIAVSTVIGAALGYANLKMVEWPRGIVMIFTLAVTLLLFGWVARALPPTTVSPMSPFGGSGFDFALTYVSVHQIGTLIVTVGVTIAAVWALTRTRAGLFVRAIYDNQDGAATVGVPVDMFVIGVWAMAGGMAGLAGILVSPRTLLSPVLLLFVTVSALVAAVIGGLESFPLALVGGLVLGVIQSVLGGVFGGQLGPGLENLATVLLMGVGVLWAGIKNRDLAHIQT